MTHRRGVERGEALAVQPVAPTVPGSAHAASQRPGPGCPRRRRSRSAPVITRPVAELNGTSVIGTPESSTSAVADLSWLTLKSAEVEPPLASLMEQVPRAPAGNHDEAADARGATDGWERRSAAMLVAGTCAITTRGSAR